MRSALKPPETTIRTPGKPALVERVAHELHELGVDAARRVVAVAALQREVGERVGGVQPHAPQLGPERLGDLERGAAPSR